MTAMEYRESTHLGMNTVMTHRAYGEGAGEALGAVREEAARLEGLLSRFVPGSDISGINDTAGAGCRRVSGDTYEVLARAAAFSGRCRGLFDITVGPLTALWKRARESGSPPGDHEIRRVLPLVDPEGLVLDPRRRTAGLRRPGQAIDLGGIGKGYAGDRFLQVMRQRGVSSAITNIGGNVAALGVKPDGSPWRVGIRHPRREGGLLGLVAVEDQAVVTSGDDQRYFTDSRGRRHHHILNPATGYPARSGLLSVTVVADSSMDADALSTMIFVAGRKRGLELLRQMGGAQAVLVDADLHVFVTAGLGERFEAAGGMKIQPCE